MYSYGMREPTGTILKTARERRGISQEDVALKAFGSARHQSLVSRYESGQVEPNLANLRKLAQVLGLSLGDFDQPVGDYPDVSIEGGPDVDQVTA